MDWSPRTRKCIVMSSCSEVVCRIEPRRHYQWLLITVMSIATAKQRSSGNSVRILVIGSGAREDALSWRLAQSPSCEAIFATPGNAGTATRGDNWGIAPTYGRAIAAKCRAERVESRSHWAGNGDCVGRCRSSTGRRLGGLRTQPHQRKTRIEQSVREAVHAAPWRSNGAQRGRNIRLTARRRCWPIGKAALRSKPTDWLRAKALS